MEARAYGGRLDAPYDHPLLSESAAELLAGETRSAEEILPELLIRTTFDGTGDGPVVITRSVEWAERERDRVVVAEDGAGRATGLPTRCGWGPRCWSTPTGPMRAWSRRSS